MKNAHGGVLILKLQDEACNKPAILLKLILLHGCFPRILNCANGTKLRNASQMFSALSLLQVLIKTEIVSRQLLSSCE